MKRPGTALSDHHLMEIVAATVETNKLDAQQARGIIAQYGFDNSWIMDDMSNKQISEALWARADYARYYARTM